MLGEISDRVAGQHRSRTGDISALTEDARRAEDLVDVQRLLGRLASMPGVRAARLHVSDNRPSDPFSLVEATLAEATQVARLACQVGPPELGLTMIVEFADPAAYGRLTPVAQGIANAADRAVRRPCASMAAVPGEAPSPLFAAVTAGCNSLIVAVDPKGAWIALSDAFCTILGYDRTDPPEVGPLELVHPHDRPAALASFVAGCAGQDRQTTIDLRVRAADGQWRVLEVTPRSFVADPAVRSVVYFGVEVTGTRATERAARTERGRLARLVETLPDGVLLIDADGTISLANESGRRLLHLDRPRPGAVRSWAGLLELLGTALVNGERVLARLDRLHTLERTIVGEELEFLDGRVLELDYVPVHVSGGPVHVSGGPAHVSGEPSGGQANAAGKPSGGPANAAGEPFGGLVHVRDVTARVATRRGLEERSKGLEERNRALAEASALNNEFVAMVAHELRGPLASVVAFSCLLADPSSAELTPDQSGYLEVIDRNANRLLRLIEDLLLLSRLESRTLRLQPTPLRLRDLLTVAVAEREAVARAAGLELVCAAEDGPEISADEARLNLVIGNLIGNALRFTPRGGRIVVSARFEAGSWRIDVVDTGIGIPTAELPRLFKAFFRGSNATAVAGANTVPGTGLGLVVCRAIVELHGGGIQVASTEGIGTTVTLTLPAGPQRTSEE